MCIIIMVIIIIRRTEYGGVDGEIFKRAVRLDLCVAELVTTLRNNFTCTVKLQHMNHSNTMYPSIMWSPSRKNGKAIYCTHAPRLATPSQFGLRWVH